MRRVAAFVVLAVAACSKAAPPPPPPAADTAPPAPPPIDMAAIAGTWDFKVMGTESDSVLTTFVMTATSDTNGWMMTLPNRKPMPMHVIVAGDSVVAHVAPYESVLRKGVKVQTTTVMRMMGSMIMGSTTAHYDTKTADSVRTLRAEGTKKP